MKSHLVRIHRVVLAIHALHENVDHGESRQRSLLAGLLDALFDRRNQSFGNRSPDDLVFELEARGSWQRFNVDVADAVHTRAARLLLELAFDVGELRRDRLAIRNLGCLEMDLEIEHAMQFLDGRADVQLAHARQQELTGRVVPANVQRRVFFGELAERNEDLFIFFSAPRLDRIRNYAAGNFQFVKMNAALFIGEHMPGVDVLELCHGDDVPGPRFCDFHVLLSLEQHQLADPEFFTRGRIHDVRVRTHSSRNDPQH